MNVYEAVTSRRATRRFSNQSVSSNTLERVLSAAARAPSGGNLQPWNIYVLTGASLTAIKERISERLASGDPGDEREFEMYPSNLKALYRERQIATAEKRYTALGLPYEDKEGRERFIAENWNSFGAPVTLFCYIDRNMGLPQWADIGMYLQTVMLLLRAEGLHSCPQMAWSVYRNTVAEVISPPVELMLFCGMSIGFEDTSLKHEYVDRAPLVETVTFLD